MKIKQIVDEHKKGVRAHKYTKKTVNPSAVHAKAKEKLQAIKPMEDMSSTPTAAGQEGTIVASDDKSVTVQMPDGTQIKKDLLGAITQDAQGNDVFNMTTQQDGQANPTQQQTPQQRLQAGTKIAISNQPPQQTMGSPARPMGETLAISEDAGVYPVNTKTYPPTVMDNGNVKGSALGTTKSGEEITPELIARSTDWQERKIQANGKIYTALYSGTRGYVVGKQTYEEITNIQRGPHVPTPGKAPTPDSRSQPLPQQGQRPNPADFKKLEESDNALLDKMLTIAGLR